MQNPKANMPPLSDRLRSVGVAQSNYYQLYSLFTEDYFVGLGELTGLSDFFQSVYENQFRRYDEESNVPLAEMAEKVAGFIPEKRTELLTMLLVKPYYYIAHTERSES